MSALHTLLGLTRHGWAGKAWRPALSRPFVAEPSDNPTVELYLATPVGVFTLLLRSQGPSTTPAAVMLGRWTMTVLRDQRPLVRTIWKELLRSFARGWSRCTDGAA
jgi:hypothetical protein